MKICEMHLTGVDNDVAETNYHGCSLGLNAVSLINVTAEQMANNGWIDDRSFITSVQFRSTEISFHSVPVARPVC